MIGSSFVVWTAGDETAAACVELWVAAVAARDGAPAPAAVRDRALAKFAAERVALVVVDDGAPDDGTADDGVPDGHGWSLAGFALVTAPGSAGDPAPTDAAYLSLLAVAPGAQGHGLGRRLLSEAVAAAAAAGYPRCELHALDGNEPAVSLYRSAGFTPSAESFPHAVSGRPTRTWSTTAGQVR